MERFVAIWDNNAHIVAKRLAQAIFVVKKKKTGRKNIFPITRRRNRCAARRRRGVAAWTPGACLSEHPAPLHGPVLSVRVISKLNIFNYIIYIYIDIRSPPDYIDAKIHWRTPWN
jgi:hypothetical protein